jgi:5-methylcytosine-specific restriction protein A
MVALILAWNPDEPQWTGTYAADVEVVRRVGLVRREWVLPADPGLDIGMDVWLLVVGSRPSRNGLIGHGSLARTRTVEQAAGTAVLLDLDVDVLLPHGDQIPTAQLPAPVRHVANGDLAALAVDDGTARAVRGIWAATISPANGSVHPVPGSLPSSVVKTVPIDRFEQDDALRGIALAHRGSACLSCGLDFEQMYGSSGSESMQVHLITPLALIDGEYEPDPLVDLVPLCPSCHVVAHSRWPDPYSVDELRTMLRHGGHLRGTVLSDRQLESEAAAARILKA